jgi:hypothetical protein
MNRGEELFRAMSDHPAPRRHVRRLVLPSGRTIEVLCFGPDALDAAPGRLEAPDIADPRRCRACGSELVYPLAWEEAGPSHWEITMRCPECERIATGVYDQEAVEQLDDALDRGTEALIADLRRLMVHNMEEEIARFARALEEDHILPEDF